MMRRTKVHLGDKGVFLPPFVRKLATPSTRNASLQGGRSFYHQRWQKDSPAWSWSRLHFTLAVDMRFFSPPPYFFSHPFAMEGFGSQSLAMRNEVKGHGHVSFCSHSAYFYLFI